MASRGKHVVIMGGGVAGLTASHELLQRGFKVTLVERRPEPGGKSRSFDGVVLDDRGNPLASPTGDITAPAEHGFRFLPGFYRHLDDTLSRIVIFSERGDRPGDVETANGRTVKDNLVAIREEILGVLGKPTIKFPAAPPRRVRDLRTFLQFPEDLKAVGLTEADFATFADKLWQIATSCVERRDSEYEAIGWREFIDSLNRSDEYYWYLASGLTRTLVAARARQASTKTMGNVALQLWSCLTNRGGSTDRVLNGPTNKAWFEPWVTFMERRFGDHFTIKFNSCVTAIKYGSARIEEITIKDVGLRDRKTAVLGEQETAIDGDYFVSALPVEVLAQLLSENSDFKTAGGEQFDNIIKLATEDVVLDDAETTSDEGPRQKGYLRWMNGVQIYLRADSPINRGHQIFINSPWGLTSISQKQFWDGYKLPSGIGGVLSVDISSWDQLGRNNKAARDCTKEEIFKETKVQLREILGEAALPDSNIVGWYLDEAIMGPNLLRTDGGPVVTNLEPILVNHTGSWKLRPSADTAIRNFFVAGDFVRTVTDLACMEGANEAARHAVNFLLDRDSFPGDDRCEIFQPAEPPLLAPLRQMDKRRFDRGLPWSGVDLGKWMVRGLHAADVLADLVFAEDKTTAELISGDRKGPPSGGAIGTEQSSQNQRDQADAFSSRPRPVAVQALSVKEVMDLRATARGPGHEDPMFKRWRQFNLTQAGKHYRIPFQVFDADALVIHGRATNYQFLLDQTRGTGYVPAFCQDESGNAGYAELWIMRYTDTTEGPYNEVVINFAANKRERRYQYRSNYSSLVPMMDSDNRLFTLRLLLSEFGNVTHGPIRYGIDLFGTDKVPARIDIQRQGGMKTFGWSEGDCSVEGEVSEEQSLFQSVADFAGFSREVGTIAALKNARQVMEGAELQGGLVTRDIRLGRSTNKTVDVLSVYKFAPKLQVFRDGQDPIRFRGTPPEHSVAWALQAMGFQPKIASFDRHLKSILYLDTWPNPDQL